MLYSFGAALGLSFSSPRSGSGASGTTFVIFVGAWLVLTQVASFGVGGYLAGRLRRRIDDAKSDEVDLRDGSHGLLVWAIVILVSTVLLTGGLFNAAQIHGQRGWRLDQRCRRRGARCRRGIPRRHADA